MAYRAATVTRASTRRDRQVIRVLGLLQALAEGGHPTIYQLAARFKTRRETIYRDIHALEAIGYAIVGDESGRLSRTMDNDAIGEFLDRAIYPEGGYPQQPTSEIEIKVWSPLTSDQVARQIEPIRNSGTRLFYLLLGRTGVQRSRQWVNETTSGLGTKIGYRELNASLSALIAEDSAGNFASRLAMAYRKALMSQYERIRKSFGKDPNW